MELRDDEHLAGGLATLLRSPNELSRMSSFATSLAQSRYGPETHLAGLLRIFRGAIAGHPRDSGAC